MSPIVCSPPFDGRFTILLPKAWSAPPTPIPRCPGGQGCVGASSAAFSATTAAVKAASSTSFSSSRVP
jgi:hypothetical protein